jgi:hypothetical protein
MATVNKDFKIKSGLVVEGQTGTINGYDILTKKQDDQDYIVGLIGGTATPDNTPDTVVKRDGSGNFAAQTVTVEVLNVSGIGTISDDGELLIAAATEEDIRLTADDIRMESVDDIRMTAQGDILLDASQPGMGVYVGSIDPGNTVVTEAIMDAHIGDNTVDGTAGNTVYDRIFNAKSEAIADAGTATDLKLADYTTTANLDTTVDGYGYLKSADLTGYATESYVDTAEQDAKDYADNLINDASNLSTEVWSAYKTNTEIGLAEGRANVYADEAVAALVDAAPAMLDTLNELAAALGDDEDFIGTVNAAIGEKVAKSGDTMTGELILSADPTQTLAAATKQYVDGKASDAYNDAIVTAADDATTKANNAEQNAKDYADDEIAALSTTDIEEGTNLYFTNQRAIDAVGGTIGDAIDELTTDDIEEGLANQYFTDSRAKDSAAALLTGANLVNITIDGTGAGLTITAENGVADSDTDDLTEGSNNLYFSDQRAQDALNGTTPNFEAVELGEISKNVAATTVVPVAGIATAYSWLKDNYRSAEFLVKVAYGDHTEISKVLLTLAANDNIAITEYGIVGTNGSASSVSAVISGNDVQLQVTTVNNTSTVTVVGTLLA